MLAIEWLWCRYVRILGAFYLRLTGSDVDVYRYLEPLYNDYRKLRQKVTDGSKNPCDSLGKLLTSSLNLKFYVINFHPANFWVYANCKSSRFMSIVTDFTLTHVDEVIDELLTKDYSCDIALPRIKRRWLYCWFIPLFGGGVPIYVIWSFHGLRVSILIWKFCTSNCKLET